MRGRLSYVHILAVCIILLAGSFLVLGQGSPKPKSPLMSLFNASTTDTAGVLSSIPETDLPLALAIADALKFKALHGDTPLTLDEVARFRNAVITRLTEAETVSLAKTEACSVPVAARELSIDGVHLKIPAHFKAISADLLDYGPLGETGTPFPTIWARFAPGRVPNDAVLYLNGERIAAQWSETGVLAFSPQFSVAGVIPIGTHSVELSFTATNATRVKKPGFLRWAWKNHLKFHPTLPRH